jgi:CheY-like chemotaxis protein
MAATIAVIDPDPAVVASVRAANEREFRGGFEVKPMPRGVDALHDMAAQRPAIVLLALHLPDLDGLTVLRRMKADTRLRDVPVAIVATWEAATLDAVARDAGAAACLRKPIEPAALAPALRLLARAWAAQARAVEPAAPAPVRRDSPAPARAAPLPLGAAAPRKRLLVVEDEPDVSAALLDILAHPRLEADLASNGIEAVARARETRPHVVLLDVRLPGMDGFEVFNVMRREPGLAAARVIFLSAHAESGALGLARELGAYACLRKPFHPPALRKKVLGALELDEAVVVAAPARTVDLDESGQFYDLGALDDVRP